MQDKLKNLVLALLLALVIAAIVAIFVSTARAQQAATCALSFTVPNLARNEVPQPAGAANTWTLARNPTAAGVTCFRNGLAQFPGDDYTLAGAKLTSTFWQPADRLACDYQF